MKRSSVALMISMLTGCSGAGVTLDNFLLAPKKGDYTLSSAIIPAWQELAVPTSDGETVQAVFVEGTTRKDVTLLYCHGNASNIGDAWTRMEYWYPLGYNLLVFDYRGYGRSTGKTTEPGVRVDTRAVRAALLHLPGINPDRLVYYGHSFGGATCIDLAATDPPTVLITESTFTSAAALVSDGAGYDLPSSFLTTLSWNSIGSIPGIRRPYLAIHGLADDYVQPRYSVELTRAHAGAGPTQLELVPGADHGGSPKTLGLDNYRSLLSTFIDANLR